VGLPALDASLEDQAPLKIPAHTEQKNIFETITLQKYLVYFSLPHTTSPTIIPDASPHPLVTGACTYPTADGNIQSWQSLKRKKRDLILVGREI
jgi:hypothetical protein